jgi:hypothetical protein
MASDDVNHDIARLLPGVADANRQVIDVELRLVLDQVAAAGFDPLARETARRPLQGQVWQGQTITTKTRLPPAVRHWLLHARVNAEWPVGTTLHQYVESLRQVILDPDSGVFVNRYRGALSLGVIRQTRDLHGPGGYDWILVQYRVATGHWTTGFQPADGLDEIDAPEWEDVRWLRRPTIRSESIARSDP